MRTFVDQGCCVLPGAGGVGATVSAHVKTSLCFGGRQGPQETTGGTDNQVVSLRRQLRIATKDKARLLQQNRSLSARMVSATGSFDLDLEGSQLSSSRTASSRSSPHPESPAASSCRGSTDGAVPQDAPASAPLEVRVMPLAWVPP